MLDLFLFAKEWSPPCRQALQDNLRWCQQAMNSSCRPPCLFGDVQGCIPEASFSKTGLFMPRFHQVAQAPLLTHQFCYTHNRECEILGARAASDWETAGLPCVDFSQAGKRQRENGPTATVFACHAKRHIHLETPVILLENVQDHSCPAACLLK